PFVGAGSPLPDIAPSLVEPVAALRHRMELPQLAAGTHVEATRVARNADRILKSGGANYRHVAGDRDGSAVGDADIDHAVLAESCSRLTGRCIERQHRRSGHDEDARRRAAIAGPVSHAARRSVTRLLAGTGNRMDPLLLSGVRVQRDDPIAG